MMPDGTYQSIFSDITERNLMERELRESEQRFRTLHNASFGGIGIFDQGLILDCNQGLADMTGYSLEELIGMDGLLLVTPEYREFVLSKVRSDHEEPYEATALRKDGSTFPVQIRGKTIPYKGKDVRVAEFFDLTGEKQAEQEKQLLEAQLNQAQKMETVGQLAGGIAHDFNNMLGVIMGHAEIALLKMPHGSPVISDLEKIKIAAGRSSEITRQLLAFARKQAVEPKTLDLNNTVEGMLQMLRRLIGEDIELHWIPGEELWPVRMDTSQLDQILVNLCINARDAIGGVGEIIVSTENCRLEPDPEIISSSEEEFVRLMVTDTGKGMDRITLDRVFEPFFTTKEVGVGTGLGLSTVYGAVKQNQGFITIHSSLGEGTTVEICLPRYHDDGKHQEEQKSSDLAGGGTETILLVEDEVTILEMTREMLEILGYEVLSASSPLKAFDIVESYNDDIHLLLTDVIMPGMNGKELAQRLNSTYPELRCLYMSGYTNDIITNQGMLDEGVSFLQKPFSQQELAKKVRDILDG